MTMTPEKLREWNLLPCPFCGGPVQLEKARVVDSDIYGKRQFWGVVCRNTTNHGGSCCMDQVPSASQEAAVKRWNMRVPHADALEEIERLKFHAEAMAARIEWYAEEGWVNGDIPEARSYRAEFKEE